MESIMFQTDGSDGWTDVDMKLFERDFKSFVDTFETAFGDTNEKVAAKVTNTESSNLKKGEKNVSSSYR